MRGTAHPLVLVMMVVVACGAWGLARAVEPVPPVGMEAPEIVLEDAAAAVEVPWALAGDVVEVEVPGAASLPLEGGGAWSPKPGRQWVWTLTVNGPGTVAFTVSLEELLEDRGARVTVRRKGDGGDEFQAVRVVHRASGTGLEIGPGVLTRVQNLVRMRLGELEGRAFPGLERDGGDWWRMRASDPFLPQVLPLAREVQPMIRATARTVVRPPTKDWVSSSNTANGYFSDRICGVDPWYGTSISIASAPAGATVTGIDLDYGVYHSVDISRFKAGIWHRDPPGGGWTDQVVLYSGTSSGSTYYNGNVTGMSSYNGSDVNTDYIIGCCNRYGVEDAYLDEWTITVYFSGSGGIDLVADSVTPAYTTVAAGGSAGLRWGGHVEGSGSVGSSFTTGIYLSTDATITTGDQLLASRIQPAGLNAGDSFGDSMFDVLFQIPSGTTPGNYWIGVLVDDGGTVAETSEGNNALATPLTVVASSGLPNLVSSDCSVSPASADAGDTVTLSYRYRNTGATGAPYFVWSHFLSTDTVFDGGDDLLVGLDVLGGFPAGYDSGVQSMAVDLPAGLADGIYYLGTVLDPGDNAVETDESDNWCTAQITIGSGGGGGPVRWLIPAAASAPGFGSSNWKTQLAVVNPDSTAHQVSVYYVAKGSAWPGVLLVPPTTLSPGRSLFLDDPLLPLNPTSGLMYVECDGAGPVVTTRTFNLASGGTYGQGIPAELLQVGSCSSLILPLIHSVPGQFHTNIGLVQADSGSVTYRITLFSPTGAQLGTRTYTRNTAFEQINDVFADMGLGGVSVEGGWARVEIEAGCPFTWTTYASVVDDRTGDPTYVMPVAE